eukprot:1142080-Pelagomonas_calceolata.AAC.3
MGDWGRGLWNGLLAGEPGAHLDGWLTTCWTHISLFRKCHLHPGGLCGEWPLHLEIICIVHHVAVVRPLAGHQALNLTLSEHSIHEVGVVLLITSLLLPILRSKLDVMGSWVVCLDWQGKECPKAGGWSCVG